MKNRLLAQISLAATLLLTGSLMAIPALAAQQPVSGGVLRIASTADPPGLDVHVDTTFAVYNRARELFNTLLRYSDDGLTLEPELLAKFPEASADGKTYTFELRRGIIAHDGSELTASDVKFSFERILTPATKSPHVVWLEPIVGAKEMADGKATSLAGFKLLDRYRFQITLTSAYAPFLSHLAIPALSIYPEAAVRRAGANWALQPVGTGPFKLKEWVRGTRLVLEKHKDYFEKGLPYLDGIEIKIIPEETTIWLEYLAGNLDYAGIPDAEFQKVMQDPKLRSQVITQSSLNTYFLMFNMNNPILKDLRVRKAIAMAIDRQTLVNALLKDQAVVATTFVSPGIPGYKALPAIEYNPAEARRLLREAGYANGFSIESWQTQSTTTLSYNEAIQAMLAAVGIDYKIVRNDSAAYRSARNSGQIPMYQGNWWADFSDPDNYLYTFFHSSQSKLYSSNYNNPRVDQLLERARAAGNPAERARLYQDAERIIVLEDVALVPLWHLKDTVIRQPWVNGLYLHPTGVNNAHKVIWLSSRR